MFTFADEVEVSRVPLGMKPKFAPAQYFHMAKQIREIAAAIEELDTRSMVSQIAEDYERMGREALGAIGEAITGVTEGANESTPS